jgi:pimeloyl-ACP methyl ester carboxylesterase
MPLHVDRRGAGPTVLVLPSFGLDSAAMAAVVEPVFGPGPQEDWTRLYVDLPGTGGSPAGEPRSDAVLDALADTVDRGSGRMAVMGWSYGGFLATGLARRLPDRVAGLMLVCTGLRIRPEDRDLTGVLASSPERGWLDASPGHLREHFASAVGRQTAEVVRRLCAVLALNGPGDDGYLVELRRDGFVLADQEMPTRVEGPVSFLTGRRDRVAGFVSLFSALDDFPQAEYVAAVDAGHYLPVEEPDLFRTSTLRWLARCRAVVDTG